MSIQKLGVCGVCGKNDAKYRCPKCETVSCSLACSKAHKKLKNSCDGIRDKTKFVPIKNFSSMELVSGKNLIVYKQLHIIITGCGLNRNKVQNS